MILLSSINFVGCNKANKTNKNKYIALYENYWNDNNTFGFTVKNGHIYLGESKYFGIGINCYDLFLSGLKQDNIDLYKKNLATLKKYDIKLIRFNCGVYYANELEYYINDKTKYLNKINTLFKLAQEYKIGLIPSLFWKPNICEFFDESISAWGNSNSQTMIFAKEYAKDVVNVAKQYKSAFAWEFGNEFLLEADLPDNNSNQDHFSTNDVINAYNNIYNIIKTYDNKNRLVETGDGQLRNSMYNQYKNFNFTQDNYAEKTRIIKTVYNNNSDCISEHLYGLNKQKFCDKTIGTKNYILSMKKMAQNLNKAYVIGEWGGAEFNKDNYKKLYSEFAQILVDTKVELSLVWNFNLYENDVEHSFSVNTNYGKDILNIIKQYNIYMIKNY